MEFDVVKLDVVFKHMILFKICNDFVLFNSVTVGAISKRINVMQGGEGEGVG